YTLPAAAVNPANPTVDLWANGLNPGPHVAKASYYSFDPTVAASTTTLAFTVAEGTNTTITLSTSQTYADVPVTITAEVVAPPGVTGGTLRIGDMLNGDPQPDLGSVAVTGSTRKLVLTLKLPAGGHWIYAEYSGADGFAVSSAGAGVTILPDDGVA